ncbi:MAG: DUF1003 domain-containing protein [Dysgonamonadaceae bacterium]|jgi:uncharacterized membrane protein|nr:DUF1003 domain-containing protein [Dysgonamonadaceae bacterium]MDD3355372.1 DUF1003 domain-containing protein [Dysgonamonadaceae bacterium]MDD3726966.1 DUF1003 domain-containing protein [Dysgonamonadaceae bacterium]MDD4245746.1 DUF1003 domain-containing protein [Dysgonamonadaceae bacterium]MDD4604858.1 DUF1003 domain-containing protein [Dysgonamonadaceae bacterium]
MNRIQNETELVKMETHKTWHDEYHATLTIGGRVADKVAKGIGSWKFIIFQTVLVVLWMVLNLVGFIYHWDVYPFILLNLLFSTQAAYAAPIIMMSQNRQNLRDRLQAEEDYKTNKDAKLEIEELAILLKSIEVDKLDKIIELLLEQKSNSVVNNNPPS